MGPFLIREWLLMVSLFPFVFFLGTLTRRLMKPKVLLSLFLDWAKLVDDIPSGPRCSEKFPMLQRR